MYPAADGYVRTAPAGSFARGASPDGAFDLAGNVAEWVDGSLVPVVRGGSYADVNASSVSSTHVQTGAVAGPSIGFRCAADR
jgi:formylglycine-generating enzyme required for sulfatase activity